MNIFNLVFLCLLNIHCVFGTDNNVKSATVIQNRAKRGIPAIYIDATDEFKMPSPFYAPFG